MIYCGQKFTENAKNCQNHIFDMSHNELVMTCPM